MKTSAWLLVGCLLPACSGNSELPGDRSTPDNGKGDVGGGYGDECLADAQFDFHVWGGDLSAWEGSRVVAAAIENENINVRSRRALLETTIQNGEFSLMCPDALHETYWYPSWAVFVDVDGDGHCTAGDVGYQMQLYGWNIDVSEPIAASSWSELSTPQLVGPIGSSADDFCAGYFE